MRKLLLIRVCLLSAGAAASPAAVIRGTVVENQTGKSLARTVVVLQPIEGTPGSAKSTRTDIAGAFHFASLPAGAYIVKATRYGFMPVEYGQKRWNSAAKPIVVEEDANPFLNIRMLRYSAVLGTVLDENYVGLPDHEVVAYRTTTPPQLVAQAITDDRGVFRIHGLLPGTYVMRAAGKQYDDESFVATFSRETSRLDQARTVDLPPEQEVAFADIRPLPGKLYSVLVAAAPPLADPPAATITLASDMGRKTVKGTSFNFTGLPPGEYEAYAESQTDSGTGLPAAAAHQRFSLGRDMRITLLMPGIPGTSVAITGAPAGDSGKLWVRRKDLAGTGTPVSPPIVNNRVTIPAGRWEVMLEPPSGYYVSGFAVPAIAPSTPIRADSWNETPSRGGVRYSLSPGSASIRGTVKSPSETVGGVPVFLEPYDPVTRKRDGELRGVRADMRGQYRFEGLAPGVYRILSTFEYLAPDVEAMDFARAQTITIEARSQRSLDLDLYLIP